MKGYKERYFEKMHVERRVDKNGRYRTVYVYDGDYYGWSFKNRELDGDKLRKVKAAHAVLYIVSAVTYMMSAIQRNGLNADKFVSVLALLALVSMIIEFTGVAEFVVSRDRLMEADMNSISMRLHVSAVLHSAFMLLASVVGIVYLIRNETFTGFVNIIFMTISGICAAVISYFQKHISPRNLGKGKDVN